MNIKYYTCESSLKSYRDADVTPISGIRPMDRTPADSDAFYRCHMDYAGDLKDISAHEIAESDSKHLLFFHIGFLESIKFLVGFEDILYECYDKGITVVVDSTWEQVSGNSVVEENSLESAYNEAGNSPNLVQEGIEKIEYLLHEDYFRILVGQDLRYINVPKKYKKFFVYYNMFAGMIYAYHKPLKRTPLYPYTEQHCLKKRYNFSCMVGKPLRPHRLQFLTDIFYRNLVDDKFLLTGIPIIHDEEFKFPDHVMSRKNAGAGGNEKTIVCDFRGIKVEVSDTQHPESVLGNMLEELINRNIDFDLHEAIILWLKTDKYLRERLQLDNWDPHLVVYLEDNIEFILSKLKFVNAYTQDVSLDGFGKLSDIRINGNSPIDDRLGIYYSNIKEKYYNHSAKAHFWRNSFKWDQVLPTGLYESHINISLETYKTGTFYTEKIWKPIFAGIPVINICTPNFIESFKRMGFEPYYNIFDYSFDKHADYFDRVTGVVDEIERLSKENNLGALINKDKEVIKHNQQQLIKVSNDLTWLELL